MNRLNTNEITAYQRMVANNNMQARILFNAAMHSTLRPMGIDTNGTGMQASGNQTAEAHSHPLNDTDDEPCEQDG